MNLISLVAGIFEPAAKLIDDLHTSEEERLEQKANLLNVQATVITHVIDAATKELEAKARIVNSEAQSDHWLAANWRPLTMLTFTALVVARFLGYSADGMTEADYENLWSLIQIGLGGYVVGRSGEKIAKTVIQAKVTGK